MARVFNGAREAALAQGTCSRLAAGRYFCLRVDECSQKFSIFIINNTKVIYAKVTLFHKLKWYFFRVYFIIRIFDCCDIILGRGLLLACLRRLLARVGLGT